MSKDSSIISSLKQNCLPILGAGLLALGASYYFYNTMKSKKQEPEPEPVQPEAFQDYEDDEQCQLPEITMPAIVSHIDGVVINGDEPTPGTKEALSQLLNPWQNTQRRMPFLFLSNGGGVFEQ